MNREAIYAAIRKLMDSVQWQRKPSGTAIKFVTKSRRVKLFADVVSQQQPSCFQAEHDEDTGQVTGMPYKWSLACSWIIFQNVAQDPQKEGAIENNLILDAVEQALKPLPSDQGYPDKRNTLGGLVHHIFISGRVFKDPGDIDGQGMMVVPIKILVP